MSRGVLLALLVAVVLRGAPILATHLGVELEEAYPQHAAVSLAGGTWKAIAPVHGALLSDLLRVGVTIRYAIGRATGRYDEPVDVLADFMQRPFPFVVDGRIVMLVASLAAVWLAAVAARRIGGPLAAPAAAAVLATCLVHVRESLHVWPDALAATGAIVAVVAALAHLDRGTALSAAGLGAALGLALAGKPSVAPVGVPVALALWWGGGSAGRVRRVAVAAVAAVVTFLALWPHVVIDWEQFALHMRIQLSGSFGHIPPTRLAWSDLMVVTLGLGPIALACAGLATGASRDRRAAAIVAAFPLLYLALLARSNAFARYFVVAAPVVASLAGAGAAAVATRLAPARPGLVTAALVAVACAGPAWRSWQHVALVRRPDTRVLAGAWLTEHVPPGTAVTLPNIVGYANPVVPLDSNSIRLHLPQWHAALLARGLGDPARTFRLSYQGMLTNYDRNFVPRDPIVVTAAHPSGQAALSTPAVNEDRLRAAGYEVRARFEGPPNPVPPGVRWDPKDADYLPLAGSQAIPRLGPTLTIWAAPSKPAS